MYRQLGVPHAGVEDARLPVEFLVPRKSQEYFEGERLLAEIQAEMQEKTLSAARRRRLVQDRCKISRELLTSLHEDFTRLDRLMCAVAAVSMEVSREQELHRFLLSVRFNIRYWLALFCLTMGVSPAHSFGRLQFLVKRSAKNAQTLLQAIDAGLSLNFDSTHVN